MFVALFSKVYLRTMSLIFIFEVQLTNLFTNLVDIVNDFRSILQFSANFDVPWVRIFTFDNHLFCHLFSLCQLRSRKVWLF